jgi:hypothetical protein
MVESKRAFHFKEIANSLVQTWESMVMRCFFKRGGHKAAAGSHAKGIAAKALAAPSKIAAT